MNLNSYCVTFNTGFYGSWLVWFISQHRGFAPCVYTYRYNHFNTMTKGREEPLHLQIHGHEWNYDQRKEHTMEWGDEETEIELKEYIMLHHEYEKFAYKINPHLAWDHMNDSHLRSMVTDMGSYICCAFLTNKSIVGNRLVNWSWDWVGEDNVEVYIDQANNQADVLANKLTDGLLLDMGALLGPDDDKALEEYWKLIEFIQVPGMKNWRDFLAEAII